VKNSCGATNSTSILLPIVTPPECGSDVDCQEDPFACNGTETCDTNAGHCLPGFRVVCDPKECCPNAVCVEPTGQCIGIPKNELCQTNSGTLDFCNPVTCSCEHVQVRYTPPALDPEIVSIYPPVTDPITVPGSPDPPWLPIKIYFAPVTPGALYVQYLAAPAAPLFTRQMENMTQFQDGTDDSVNLCQELGCPTDPANIWSLQYDGTYEPPITLTFRYDGNTLLPGMDESLLVIYHRYNGDQWEILTGEIDTGAKTIIVSTDTLGIFILGLMATYVDHDGDGYTEVQGDCDDDSSNDASICATCTCGTADCAPCASCIHPGAKEVNNDMTDSNCDGKDNSCLIATASFGTEGTAKLLLLQGFRDNY